MLERFARLALTISIASTLLACSPAAVASFLPAAAAPLVAVTTRGGECVDGPCGSTTVIERDGRIHQTAPAAAELGAVPAEVLSALDTAVKSTDFGVIRSRPFTRECPVAFDGQELIYEFGAPPGSSGWRPARPRSTRTTRCSPPRQLRSPPRLRSRVPDRPQRRTSSSAASTVV
jgi:hypothetical protein